ALPILGGIVAAWPEAQMETTVMTTDEVLAQLRGLKDQLCARFGITRIGVFGSMARGDQGPESDVDIVVEMEPNLYKRAELREELQSRFGRPVDVIRYRD